MVNVETQVVRYRGSECNHINEIEFVGSTSPWESKTTGCQQCGMTQQFDVEPEKSDIEGNEDMNVQHAQESDLNEPDTETDVEQDDEQEQDKDNELIGPEEALEMNSSAEEVFDIDDGNDAVPMSHDFIDILSYRQLQKVASEVDGVKGNQKQDELITELKSEELVSLTNTINDVFDVDDIREVLEGDSE